jgi:hypothetical protein
MRIRIQLSTRMRKSIMRILYPKIMRLQSGHYMSKFLTYQTYRTDFAGDHLIDVTYLDFPLAPRHLGTFLLLPHVKIMYRYIFEGLCI